MNKVYVAVTTIVVLFGVNVFLAFKNSRNAPFSYLNAIASNGQRQQAYLLPISGPNYIPILNSNVAKPEVSAKSAVVYDTRSGRILYEKKISDKLPIASLTKVLTAVVVRENLNQNDIITIASDSIKVDGEKQDLYLGERISVQNLIKLMLIESSNDAAYALASYSKSRGIDFVGAMNLKAKTLDMSDSHFFDPAGLDDNAYSTVEDLVKLVEYSLNYQEIWNISSEKTAIIESSDEKIKHSVMSTNHLLGLLKNIIGGKTGYTDGAGQCMILITSVPDYNGKIVSIVLSSDDRFGDTQKLVDWTRIAYKWR